MCVYTHGFLTWEWTRTLPPARTATESPQVRGFPDKTKVVVAEVVIAKLVFSYIFEQT